MHAAVNCFVSEPISKTVFDWTGHPQLQIRQSVGGGLDFPAIPDYRERDARNPMSVHLLRYQIVNLIRMGNPQESCEG